MEILDLRHFSSADLRPLLYKESAEWMRSLCWDYSGSAEMVLRYMDAKILPGYAAIESGRVQGFSFFVYEGSKGVIGDLFVDRDAGVPREAAPQQPDPAAADVPGRARLVPRHAGRGAHPGPPCVRRRAPGGPRSRAR